MLQFNKLICFFFLKKRDAPLEHHNTSSTPFGVCKGNERPLSSRMSTTDMGLCGKFPSKDDYNTAIGVDICYHNKATFGRPRFLVCRCKLLLVFEFGSGKE
jgi:hypothetical protein